MNTLFKKTPIWQLLMIYLLANVLNVLAVIPLKLNFGLIQAVSDELMRVIMFIFIFIFMKNNIRIDSEFRNLKRDTNIKECGAVIIFNYSVSIAMVLVLLLAVTKLFPPELINKLTEEAIQPTGFIGAVIGLITASILAPIAEELLFNPSCCHECFIF